MDKTLSQDEMSALLNSDRDSARGPGSNKAGAEATGAKLTVVDFSRPDGAPKYVLRTLQQVFERFCAGSSLSFSAYFRAVTEVSMASFEQSTFSEFLQSMPDPTCLTVLSMRPLTGMAALEIQLDLAFPLIDRLLGSSGHIADSGRKMTDIEKNVIRGVVKLIGADWGEAWRPVTEVNFQIHTSESRPQSLQIAAAGEAVFVFAFQMAVGETRGGMQMCIPYAAFEPISARFEQKVDPLNQTANYADLNKILRTLLRAPFEITCEPARTMISVRDLLGVANGDIIALDAGINDSVEVHVGGKLAFLATAAEIDGHKGATIVRRLADQAPD